MTSRANASDAQPMLWARVVRETLMAAGRSGLDTDALRLLAVTSTNIEEAMEAMWRYARVFIVQQTEGR